MSSIWILASGPEPMITLSSSPMDSILWPLGPLICRVRLFRGEIIGLLDRIAKSVRQRLSTDFCNSGMKLSRIRIKFRKVVFFRLST